MGLGAAPVTGYTGGPVTSGGSIKGRVTFAGRPSRPKPVKCARDSDVCGRPRLDQRLTVGASGGLANVIVSLTDIHAGKSLPAKSVAKLAIKACNYSPRVLAVPLGTHLLVSNRDPIPHDFNGSRGDRVLFNRQVLTDQERLDMSARDAGTAESPGDRAAERQRGRRLRVRHQALAGIRAESSSPADSCCRCRFWR